MSKYSTTDFFDEKAAARIAEVHPRTMRRWRERGLVTCYRTPTGRIRYRLDDLLVAVSQQRMSADAPNCP
jgi:DNA-binding transcriptional MerR regulator